MKEDQNIPRKLSEVVQQSRLKWYEEEREVVVANVGIENK